MRHATEYEVRDVRLLEWNDGRKVSLGYDRFRFDLVKVESDLYSFYTKSSCIITDE